MAISLKIEAEGSSQKLISALHCVLMYVHAFYQQKHALF